MVDAEKENQEPNLFTSRQERTPSPSTSGKISMPMPQLPSAGSISGSLSVLEAQYFSPEALRPHPKAGPRTGKQKGRKKRVSAVLTDTPIKEALEAEKSKRSNPAKRKVVDDKAQKKKTWKGKTPVPVKKPPEVSSDDEDECFCLVCLEPYQQSRGGETWVRCLTCRGWSHEACTKGDTFYVCHNCESE